MNIRIILHNENDNQDDFETVVSTFSKSHLCIMGFSTIISTRQSVLPFRTDKDDEKESDDGDDDSKDLCDDNRG